MSKLDIEAILEKVAAKTGSADPRAVEHLRPGAVFEVADKLVHFPNEVRRKWHDFRRVVIVQAFGLLGPVAPDTVLVVPCSASQHGARTWDFAVPPDEPGFTRNDVVAYASLVFPVLKAALTREGFRAQMRPETYGLLQARIAKNFELAPEVTLPPRR
jgi:hypothetical protein